MKLFTLILLSQAQIKPTFQSNLFAYEGHPMRRKMGGFVRRMMNCGVALILLILTRLILQIMQSYCNRAKGQRLEINGSPLMWPA